MCMWKNILITTWLIASTTIVNASEQNQSPENKESYGLSWKNLYVSRTKHEKGGYILYPSHGFVGNGHMCGIIGPSGAGKSSLLSALSGTTLKSSNLEVYGSVWIDERNSESREKESISLSLRDGEIALLTQDSSFFPMLTPREILSFASFFQLPKSHSVREGIVDRTIEALGLANVQHNRVGDRNSGQGISGGEKRRLAVGVELVTRPKVFFADEPTTGLDSFQAERVIRLMRELAKKRNIPCLCVLHQPRTSIWKQFDSFILLAPGGRMCYMGSRSNATEYFSSIGYECPDQTNPAEYFIDLVSINTEDPERAIIDNKRIERIHSEFMKSNEEAYNRREFIQSLSENSRNPKIRYARSWKRFGALFGRAWRQNIRDSRQNIIRFFASIGQALLFSQIFKSVVKGTPLAKSVADRTAMLSFSAICMSMMSLTKALNLFGGEKPIITRERMRHQYSGFEYLVSKTIAELPLDTFFSLVFVAVLKLATGVHCSLTSLMQTFAMSTISAASLGFAVGSFSRDKESALILGIPLMVIFMAVGVINPSGVDVSEPPSALVRWLKSASPIKWVIEALCISEFKGMKFGKTKKGRFWGLPKMGAFAAVRNGDQVLDAIGLAEKSYMSVITSLAKLSGFNLCVALIGLIFTKTDFIEIETNEEQFLRNIKVGDDLMHEAESFAAEVESKPHQSVHQIKPVTVTGTHF